MTGKRFGKFKTINFANAGNYNALLTQQDNFFFGMRVMKLIIFVCACVFMYMYLQTHYDKHVHHVCTGCDLLLLYCL